MIQSTCKHCNTKCYKAVNERNGQSSEQYYSEVVAFRLTTHLGGVSKAVPLHGIYQLHRCAGKSSFVLPRVKANAAGSRGITPSHVVRARRRKNFVSSGRN